MASYVTINVMIFHVGRFISGIEFRMLRKKSKSKKAYVDNRKYMGIAFALIQVIIAAAETF